MDVLILLACFIVYVILSEWYLKKKYSIKREKGIFVKYVNKTHKIIERMLLIIFLGISFLSKGIYAHYSLIVFFITLFLVRSISEWKYERERKKYILELNGLIAFIILVIIGINKAIF